MVALVAGGTVYSAAAPHCVQRGSKNSHDLISQRRGLVAPGRLRTVVARAEAIDTPATNKVAKDGKPAYDLVASARKAAATPAVAPAAQPPLGDFLSKVKAAWRIFFPEQPKNLTPKEEGKRRLRMILVADRCGMNETSLVEMKTSIVRAVSDYVDIEAEELVNVNVSSDPDLGTIYSVSVPVRRVKPQARVDLEEDGVSADGISLEWDQEDWEADPSARFPYGC